MGTSPQMHYGEYLQLPVVLGAQAPRSDAHDELLFIVQHQTSELWMKLAIHEIRAAVSSIRADSLPHAFKMLSRVGRIFEQLNQAWDVLRTMTPSEYTQFRDALGQSSGFQSAQYREIEFLVGNKNADMIEVHRRTPNVASRLEAALNAPSLYDEALMLLSRHRFQLAEADLARDWRLPRRETPEALAAWRTVYRDPEQYWDLYNLAEKLTDLEDYFRRWRFNHVTTVERIIGLKRGTGGTAGVSYLRKMLDVVLFPELWKVRTDL
ncbi:MAG: tryptophan 2,3-dioxygenase [Pseudomonadota bacterium]